MVRIDDIPRIQKRESFIPTAHIIGQNSKSYHQVHYIWRIYRADRSIKQSAYMQLQERHTCDHRVISLVRLQRDLFKWFKHLCP
jgi:hypothetical protein